MPVLLLALILAGRGGSLPAQVNIAGSAPGTTVAAPDLSTEEARSAYKAARTPRAVITLVQAAASKTALSGPVPVTVPAAPVSAEGRVFPDVCLTPDAARGALPALPPASVTLQFDPARAGQLVTVQALDGGELTAVDADGATVTAQGGFDMEIGVTGTVVFTYRAPAVGGRYQLAARLDNVSTILPFQVPDIDPAK